MSNDASTLFERLGGPEGVRSIVEEMYRRVLEDPALAPFFVNVELDQLKRMQFAFLASALDGPANYTGSELTEAHRGKGITARHFALFCGHFADAMELAGAPKTDIEQALGRLALYKDRITGDTNVDG